MGWGPYDEEVVAGDEAVATVACDLMVAGVFRTIAIAEGAGEVEKRCVLHFEDCFKARTAFLAGVDRSILEDCGKSGEKRRERSLEKRRDAANGSAQMFIDIVVAQW
jgi:hypothetical protein